MNEEYGDEFEEIWSQYPDRPRNPKRMAWKAWKTRIAAGVSHEMLLRCVKEYAGEMRAKHRTGSEYVMMAATFLGPSERWKSYLPKEPVKTPLRASPAREQPISERMVEESASKPVSREEGRAFVRQIMETLTRAKTSPAINYGRSR